MPALAEGRGMHTAVRFSHVLYAGTPDREREARVEPKGAKVVESATPSQGRVQISTTLEPCTRFVAEGTNLKGLVH